MRIAFIGFGEAGSAIAGGWGAARAGQIRVTDLKLDGGAGGAPMRARCAELGVEAAGSKADALAGAEIVISTVTADQAMAAARQAAPHLDCNSCAPGSKRISEEVITRTGGRYLDVAIMSPIYPAQHLSPCLISGTDAEARAEILRALPMNVTVVPGPVGRASSIKMIRSVLVKGMEALTAECALAAIAAGVEDAVFPSLKEMHPKIDIEARAAYNFERMLEHGERRAAEMEEVAKTLTELGLPNGMSAACVDWQRAIARSGAPMPEGRDAAGAAAFAAELLPRLRQD